jgi:NOL1/NOP2/sun family putative RNA methylase
LSRARRAVDLGRYRNLVPEWHAFVEAAARPEPPVFRVRTGRADEGEVLHRLRRQGFRVRPVEGMPSFHRVEDAPFPVSLTLEHWEGLLYVQQASTGVAAPALGAVPGERVLDLCAAPGGKTSHLADLMGDRGALVASEIDERRIRALLGNLYRLCHPGVLVVACDGRRFPGGALFDRVLVDAPCSGEGTLRRRSGEAPNQSPEFVARITRVQRALLEHAVGLVRPGGTVLYVTCTFNPEENEAVVSDVLRAGGVELEPLALAVPHAPGLTSAPGLELDPRLERAARIYPHHLDSGGLFLAKLRRLGDDPPALAGAPDGDAGGDRTAGPLRQPGWSPVPGAFPGEGASEPAARDTVARALEAISVRYGVERSRLDGWRWIVRGGRVWAHTASEWPLAAWRPGGWRVVSLGVRALELDPQGRPRPTNDLLRMLGPDLTQARVELSAASLLELVEGRPVRVEQHRAPPGPVALALDGRVIGRGRITPQGLVGEVPKSRATELARALRGLTARR